MNICVVGVGYVGLVAGTCFAEVGNSVICVDNNKEKIDFLNKGKIPIYEPSLEELVKINTKEKRLAFSSDLDDAVKNSQVCFIAVGTPQDEDGSCDLKHVLNVAKSIAKAMNEYKIIVNKSTVPVGSAEKIEQIIKENTKYSFDIVSNPEFLKQGNAVSDFLSPDRVIIGSKSQKALKVMREIYSPFFRVQQRIIEVDNKSAEMIKYAANSFLATKISFINEIANLCEKTGADIDLVRLGISSDSRIGNKFLFAGLGYGGSCFPKDVKALIKTGLDNGCEMSLMSSVDKINAFQRKYFVQKIVKRFGEDLSEITFGIWGLAYKPKTDDMREAPSITVINELLDRKAKIKCYDLKAMDSARKIFKDKIEYCNSSYDALLGADALLLLTEWNEFRYPDFDKIKSLLKQPIIFDGRNQYNYNDLKEYGFEYYKMGKA